jgi:hypothetical protein
VERAVITDGRILLGIATLISIGVFFNGRRFARMAENPWVGRRFMGMPLQGSNLPIERLRSLGRMQMIAAPFFWLFFAAMCFGLLGPTKGIATIHTPWSGR